MSFFIMLTDLNKMNDNISYINYISVNKIYFQILKFGDFKFGECSKIGKIGQHCIPAQKTSYTVKGIQKMTFSSNADQIIPVVQSSPRGRTCYNFVSCTKFKMMPLVHQVGNSTQFDWRNRSIMLLTVPWKYVYYQLTALSLVSSAT